MSLTPPKERLWWNEPIEKTEILWIGIAFLWAIIMFAMMPLWHVVGKQNISNEAYRITGEAFTAKAEAMVAKYKIREDAASGMPVVHPPPGSDVYLVASMWQWYPIIELEKGQSYRVHLSSVDWQHGFSLQPANINLQVHPGIDFVVTMTPNDSGEFGIVCNEFCGIGHHTMVGRMLVADKK